MPLSSLNRKYSEKTPLNIEDEALHVKSGLRRNGGELRGSGLSFMWLELRLERGESVSPLNFAKTATSSIIIRPSVLFYP